jgi:outer membrane biosynthesis protein TonB
LSQNWKIAMCNNALFLAVALLAATVPAAAATAAPVADPTISRWLESADRALQMRLERANVPSGDQRVDLRFDIDGPYLRNPQVVKSSGSPTVDATVAKALRSTAVQTPPPVLTGHAIVVHVPVDLNETASIGHRFGL